MAGSAQGGVDADEDASASTADKIAEAHVQVVRLQEWWGSFIDGPPNVAGNPILCTMDPQLMAEIVSAAGGYHNILSADRLDALYRRYGSTTEPSLEPLRKSLQARGGSKSQARAVGTLLFNEAMSLLDHVPAGIVASMPTPQKGGMPIGRTDVPHVHLDEVYVPARRFVPSAAYPAGAEMAARAAPNSSSDLVARFSSDFPYMITGRAGDYLEVDAQDGQNKVYVLHTIDGTVLLVPAPTTVRLDEEFTPPLRWLPTEKFPVGAMMAVRDGPSQQSKQIAQVTREHDYVASGRCGDFLQISLKLEDSSVMIGYVLHALNDQPLLRPVEPQQLRVQHHQHMAATIASPARSQSSRSRHQDGQATLETDAASATMAERLAQAVEAGRIASDKCFQLELKIAKMERQMQSQLQSQQAKNRQISSMLAQMATLISREP